MGYGVATGGGLTYLLSLHSPAYLVPSDNVIVLCAVPNRGFNPRPGMRGDSDLVTTPAPSVRVHSSNPARNPAAPILATIMGWEMPKAGRNNAWPSRQSVLPSCGFAGGWPRFLGSLHARFAVVLMLLRKGASHAKRYQTKRE